MTSTLQLQCLQKGGRFTLRHLRQRVGAGTKTTPRGHCGFSQIMFLADSCQPLALYDRLRGVVTRPKIKTPGGSNASTARQDQREAKLRQDE